MRDRVAQGYGMQEGQYRSTMQYRPDIQILRGIAVLVVVLFHLEIGGFTSGYLGVDIFFVISGFLMARLYDPTRKRDFFLRRAKRLLPAYFAVILGTLALSTLITTPNDFRGVVEQSLFGSTFSSNIGFWYENSYFDKATFKPLLHLWSLGVEIQFYLLVPILYWLIANYRASYLVLLLTSLAACIGMVGVSPKTAFFMLPFRLWEFLIGYGVAVYLPMSSSREDRKFGWVGAACLMILIGIPMMDVDGQALGFVRGHPGIHALIVASATGLILAVGLPRKIANLRIAGLMEKLGKYSYSVYLVHFPVIVLFLYQPFSGTILKTSSAKQTAILVVAICLLFFLTYHFIEGRLRSHKRAPQWILASGLAVWILCPIGMMLQALKLPQSEMAIYQAWMDRDAYRCGKINRLIEPTAKSCEITEKLTQPAYRVLLVGDSHADSIKATVASVAQSRNISVRFMVENNPLLHGGITAEGLVHEASLMNASAIVMHYSPGSIKASTVEQVVALAERQGIEVSFIMPVPTWNEHVPLALWKNLKQQRPLPTMTSREYLDSNHSLEDALSRIPSEHFKIYRVAKYFCRDACQLADGSGKPLYFDQWHLTRTGSELLRELFGTVLVAAQ